MATLSKLEKDVEIQSSADLFFHVLSKQIHHAQAAHSGIHEVEVHEGTWDTPGSIKQWKYTLDGQKVEILKEKVHVDEDKKLVVLEAMEGSSVLEERFKAYKIHFHVISNGEGKGSTAKIMIEYEKKSEDVPPPQKEMEFLVKGMNDIDAHLCKKA